MSFRFHNPKLIAALVAANVVLVAGDPTDRYGYNVNNCNACHSDDCSVCCCLSGKCGYAVGPHMVAVKPADLSNSAFKKYLAQVLRDAGFTRDRHSGSFDRRFHVANFR